MYFVLGSGIKDIPFSLSCRADLEDASLVSTSVAIVGCTPDGRQSVVEHDHVPFVTKLMCAENVYHGVDLEEFLDDLCAKCITGSSWTQGELVAVGVRITPDQIGHGTFVRNLSEAIDDLDLIDAMNAGRQTTVDAEDFVVNDAGEGKVVEHVGEVMPDSSVAVLAAALCIEAVGLGNSSRLVVATDEMDAVRIAEFETDQQRDGFDTEEAAINVVACVRLDMCLVGDRVLYVTYRGRDSLCLDMVH
jgi:hypothetical protein